MNRTRRAFLVLILLCLPAHRSTAQSIDPVAQHLAQALQIPTVSAAAPAPFDRGAFLDFLTFLETAYPHTFATLEVERINELSLLMKWPGRQPALPPVLFDAHYDVVPVEPGTREDWTHPPFSGVIEDGFVWGRGAIDDKVAVIATLEALEGLTKAGAQPSRTLYFSFVHDEEVGGEQGAAAVVKHLSEAGISFDYVVGEGGGVLNDHPLLPGQPVAMIGLAEKTYLTLILRAAGTGGHSSMPPAESSIVRLGDALKKLHENPFKPRLTSPVKDMFRAVGALRTGATGFMMRHPDLVAPLLRSQLAKEPAGNAMIRTTIAVTMIEAGIRENVVPQQAEARVNLRVLPDEDIESVIEAVRRRIDDPAIEIESKAWQGNPGIADIDGPGYARVRDALMEAVPGLAVMPGLMMATTDSRHYAALTPNLYRFHPMTVEGDLIGTVHGTNERIPIAGLQRGVAIYRALIQHVGAD